MELRIIDSLQDFMELKDEYLRLIQDNKGLTPFYTHRWLTAWWGAFEEHYKVKVFCVYKQKRLILAIQCGGINANSLDHATRFA